MQRRRGTPLSLPDSNFSSLGHTPPTDCSNRSFECWSSRLAPDAQGGDSGPWSPWHPIPEAEIYELYSLCQELSQLAILIGCSLLCNQSGANLHIDPTLDNDYNSTIAIPWCRPGSATARPGRPTGAVDCPAQGRSTFHTCTGSSAPVGGRWT